MILSARIIMKRLVESGCLPVGALEGDQGRITPIHSETSKHEAPEGDSREPGRHLIISPFAPESLQPASYDLRASQDIVLTRGGVHPRAKPGVGGTSGRSCGNTQVQIVVRQAGYPDLCRVR